MRRAPLVVGEPIENSYARYWPVAPADAPHAVVTVSLRRAGNLVCHTCYTKSGPCRHTDAVRDHLSNADAVAA
jgi:hypothetical protein